MGSACFNGLPHKKSPLPVQQGLSNVLNVPQNTPWYHTNQLYFALLIRSIHDSYSLVLFGQSLESSSRPQEQSSSWAVLMALKHFQLLSDNVHTSSWLTMTQLNGPYGFGSIFLQFHGHYIQQDTTVPYYSTYPVLLAHSPSRLLECVAQTNQYSPFRLPLS
ncbi:hypothetical protein FRB91_003653 [Serendipita sp. 411]|nr:hypothetical protein FRB91_003653 [Serendipita sp. 411]